MKASLLLLVLARAIDPLDDDHFGMGLFNLLGDEFGQDQFNDYRVAVAEELQVPAVDVDNHLSSNDSKRPRKRSLEEQPAPGETGSAFDVLLAVLTRHPHVSAPGLYQLSVAEGLGFSREQVSNFRSKIHIRTRLPVCVYDLLVLQFQARGGVPDATALAAACKTRIYANNEDLRRWVSLVIAKGVTPAFVPGNQVKLKPAEFQAFLVDIAIRRGVEVSVSSVVVQPTRRRVYTSELSSRTFHALLLLMQESPEATGDELHAAMLANGWTMLGKVQVKNFREKTIRRARLPVWAFQQLEAGFAEFGPAYCPKTSDLICPIAGGTPVRHSGADLQRWIDVVIATGEEPMVVPNGRDVAMNSPQFKRMLDLLVAERTDPVERPEEVPLIVEQVPSGVVGDALDGSGLMENSILALSYADAIGGQSDSV